MTCNGFEIDDEGYVRVPLNDGTLSFVGHMEGEDVRFDTLICLTYHLNLYPLDSIHSMWHDRDGTVHVRIPGTSHEHMGEPDLCVWPSRAPVTREPVKNIPKGAYNPSPILSHKRTDGVLDLDEVPDLNQVGAKYIIAWLRPAPNPTKEETETAVNKFLDAGDRDEIHDMQPIPSNLFTFRELNALMIEGYIFEASAADDAEGLDRFLACIVDADYACDLFRGVPARIPCYQFLKRNPCGKNPHGFTLSSHDGHRVRPPHPPRCLVPPRAR